MKYSPASCDIICFHDNGPNAITMGLLEEWQIAALRHYMHGHIFSALHYMCLHSGRSGWSPKETKKRVKNMSAGSLHTFVMSVATEMFKAYSPATHASLKTLG